MTLEYNSALFSTIFILLTLFSILLGSEKIFLPLHHQNILKTFFLHPLALRHIIIIRILIHWLFHVLPAACLSPLMMALLLQDTTQALLLAVPILIGSFTLGLLNALVAALTLALPSGAFFSSLIFLPLATPFLIFTLIAAETILNTPPHALWQEAFPPLLLLFLAAPLLMITHFFLTPVILRQTCS